MPSLDLSAPQAQDSVVSSWLTRIQDTEKLWKKFREEGKRITKIYEADDSNFASLCTPFNILYSNTETLSPALYSQVPRPVVGRRYKDADPLGKAVSDVLTRTLEFLLDDGVAEYPDFDTLMKKAVTEALVPGWGVTRIKYDADVTDEDPKTGKSASVNWETVCGKQVPWDRFVCGYSKTWQETPWIAFIHYMDKEELEKNFTKAIADKVNLSELIPDKNSSESEGQAQLSSMPGACVYEIWDKSSKQVLFISPGYREGLLKPAIPDPLELSGFFPTPEPLKFFDRISSMVPVSLYTFYEEQAKELNKLTTRISRIINALKVRGFYDSSLQNMDLLFSSDDNALLPADNCAALQDKGGLSNAIWLVPVEKLIQVLQSLYIQREACKGVIYEIMGIGDILRGASKASETAAAQNIKSQWGSLRLKRMQKEVMRYSRDLLRIMVEVSAKKLDPSTIKAMTGAEYPTREQVAQAQAVAQANPQQAEQLAQSQPELLEFLSLPTWEDIFEVLSSPIQRAYKIDVETNSTIDADATEDKQAIAEFLGGFSQMMISLQPLVQAGALPFEAAKSMILAMIRRYNFGPQVERELEQMKAPEPAQSPEMEEQAKQLMQKEEDLAKKEQELTKRDNDVMVAESQLKTDFAKAKNDLDAQAESNRLNNDYAKQELALQAEYNRKVSALDKQISNLESLSKPAPSNPTADTEE